MAGVERLYFGAATSLLSPSVLIRGGQVAKPGFAFPAVAIPAILALVLENVG
jgi:hypothetical protein